MAMKILHINTERTWRGGEQQTLYLAAGLHNMGVATGVVCQPGSPMETRTRDAGVPVHPVKMRGEWDLGAVLAIRRIIKRDGYDIVHMHTSHAHTLGVLAARIGRIAKTVVSRRVDFSIYRHRFSLSGLKYKFGVDRYIAISRAIKDVLIKDGIPADEISVVHSGIDLSRFDDVDGSYLRQEFGMATDQKAIGVVAHFGWHKGLEYLVGAAPRVKAALPGVKIFLVGTGEFEEALRAQAVELGVDDCLVFTGFRKDIPEMLDFLDIFVMPSVMEGLCTSILDALASYKPVVGCAVGGIPEIIEHEKTGLLVEPRDSAGLAEALVKMAGNEELARNLAERGQKKVLEQFSVAAMVRGVLGVYEEFGR